MLLEGVSNPKESSPFYGDQARKKREQARESLAAISMLAVAKGMSPLHAAGLGHRDVKPENIFFDRSGEAMLADFGLVERNTPNGAVAGTYEYLPFEALLPSTARRADTPYSAIKSDTWGAGATALFMLVETTPTEDMASRLNAGQSPKRLQSAVLDQQFDFHNAWLKHAAVALGGKTGPLPEPETEEEAYFLNMFSAAKQASERLFPTLLRALHPLPHKRPDAASLLQDVKQAMADRKLDLASIITATGLGGSQHWTPDTEAQQQLQRIDAAKRQRQTRSVQQRAAAAPNLAEAKEPPPSISSKK